MRRQNLIFIITVILFLYTANIVYAGGPGFEKDVYTWGTDDNHQGGRGDDDYHNWGDDDDNHHHGDDDDDHWGGGDDDDNNNGCDDDSNEVPLDGGLSFLAIAGAGLGIKAARDNMAKKKNK